MADHEVYGFGILRSRGGGTAATADVIGGRVWELSSAGLFRLRFHATEPGGAEPVGELRVNRLQFSGSPALDWYGHRYVLQGGVGRSTQILTYEGRALARFHCSGFALRSFASTVEDPRTDAGVLLFGAFCARILGRMRDPGSF